MCVLQIDKDPTVPYQYFFFLRTELFLWLHKQQQQPVSLQVAHAIDVAVDVVASCVAGGKSVMASTCKHCVIDRPGPYRTVAVFLVPRFFCVVSNNDNELFSFNSLSPSIATSCSMLEQRAVPCRKQAESRSPDARTGWKAIFDRIWLDFHKNVGLPVCPRKERKEIKRKIARQKRIMIKLNEMHLPLGLWEQGINMLNLNSLHAKKKKVVVVHVLFRS